MTRPPDRQGDELARAQPAPAPIPEVEAHLGAGNPELQRVASLQRSAGNQAVARMLEQQRRPPPRGLADLPRRGGKLARDIAPGPQNLAAGAMDIKMIAKNDGPTGGRTGLDGSVTFTPNAKSPYSSKIGLIQMVKLTDEKGTDVNAASMPAASAPHLRSKEDKGAGVEGGYMTDALHRNFGAPGNPVAPKGGSQTHYYQGGAPQFGFRRSEKADDIKAAQLTDFPSTTGKDAKLNFAFETVAKGDDNQVIYGSVKWAFNIREGKVQDETSSFTDGASATFDSAMERHREFYVHEPVTVYFDFDADDPSAGEDAKFGRLVPYLTKFADVHVKAEGFADLRGAASHNLKLAQRRAQKCIDALVALGIDATRFDAALGTGITTSFAADAVTPQEDEANRRANRRVMLTFRHVPAATPAPAPATP